VLNWLSIKPWRRMWSECIGDLILDLGYSWRRIGSRWYPLCERLNGPQYRSGRRRAEKNLAPTGAIWSPTLGLPARNLLRYPHSYYQSHEAEKGMVCLPVWYTRNIRSCVTYKAISRSICLYLKRNDTYTHAHIRTPTHIRVYTQAGNFSSLKAK
jgi:hypothetical protein